MKKIACIGLIVADFVIKPVTQLPEKGKITLVDTAELHIGGCAANTAIVAKNLGSEVSVIGKVGNDALGEFLINELKKAGIEISAIKIDKDITSSGTSVLVHSDGERSFIHSIGANGKLTCEDMDFQYLENFAVIHIGGVLLMDSLEDENLEKLCRQIKNMNKILTVDTAWDFKGKWLSVIEKSLPYMDYFLPSIEEAKMISGKENAEEICKFFLDRGVQNVCLKMGGNGSLIMNKTEKYYFPPIPVDVVSTLGAGDAYIGGFLVGLLKEYSFQNCGLLANITGAQAVTSMGATSGIKNWKGLLDFAKKHNLALP
ncbi:MAG: carbohydrate kinase family protein [Candidatus Omnitrophica bacterium]|nr:carbohydrate kinase family protein [Candidatus Omnitrophota bacterium]